MNTLNTNQNEGFDSSNIKNLLQPGAGGGGLASMAAALAGITITTKENDYPFPVPLTMAALAAAWYAGHLPAGPLLAACMAAAVAEVAADDLRRARRTAEQLARRIVADGRTVGAHDKAEAASAAVTALVAWRCGGQPDGCKGEVKANGGLVTPASSIAWRAVVAAMADDGLGQTTEQLNTLDDDCILARALPCESRSEQHSRWAIEATRAYWVHTLAQVRSNLGASGGGKRRADFADRACNALALLMRGESIDTAAALAGFNVRGRNKPGDQLVRALAALGFELNGFSIRRNGARTDKGARDVQRVVPAVVLPFIPFKPVALPLVTLTAGRAGSHCGAACLAAAAVRAVVVRGASPARLAARVERARWRWEWSQLPASARLAALPVADRRALILIACQACARQPVALGGAFMPYTRRGLLA